MKVLVLGASGATGRAFAQVAMYAGHDVTAFTRDPGRINLQGAKLRVVQGDVYRLPSLDAPMLGHDAVVFCVGPGPNVKESRVRTEGMRNTITAMTKAGVKRLVALSGLGAGVSRKAQGFFYDKIAAPFMLRGVLEDQNGMEAEIRKSKLDWVVVRPGEMTDAAGKGKWVLSLDGSGVSKQVARADVIGFMVSLLQSDEYLQKTPAIGY